VYVKVHNIRWRIRRQHFSGYMRPHKTSDLRGEHRGPRQFTIQDWPRDRATTGEMDQVADIVVGDVFTHRNFAIDCGFPVVRCSNHTTRGDRLYDNEIQVFCYYPPRLSDGQRSANSTLALIYVTPRLSYIRYAFPSLLAPPLLGGDLAI